MIRVLLADDHPVVQFGLGQALSALPDMEVIAVAGNGKEAVEKTGELQPNVVLLDLSMPEMNGIDATRLIKGNWPEVRVVIFSMQDREAYLRQVFQAGADGYVLKGAPISEVAQAIRDVHKGAYFLSPRIQKGVIQSFLSTREDSPDEMKYDKLSDREQQILRLLVEGHSTSRIGEMLFISPKTVETHRTNIMQKLGIETLVDLIKYSMRISIIDPDEWQG
jgi:two-component system, NarL family, response regulator NreC